MKNIRSQVHQEIIDAADEIEERMLDLVIAQPGTPIFGMDGGLEYDYIVFLSNCALIKQLIEQLISKQLMKSKVGLMKSSSA